MAAPQQPEAFVRWFRQVAPYVHDFGGRTFVVAFGGEMLTDHARFASFVHDLNVLAALEIRLVLVHGARPQIEAELKARGVRSKYAQGLRVTDERALQAVKGAAGVLRVELEAQLSQGLPDSPMARAQIRVASGNYITARPIGVRKGIDFQFTGAVRKVDAAAITSHLDVGDIVVVPHLGYSPTGEVFNLAWEDVAENVAVALKADKLLMYTDRLPEDRKGEVVSELTAEEAEMLAGKKSNLTPAAMRALEHAARAVAAGVARGHLVTRRAAGSLLLELFTHAGVGTMITSDALEKLRPARIEDVRGILALIEPLEAEGTLVKRSRELLEAEIGNFLVVEHDGAIAGCAALYPLEDKGAEFACLAVAPQYRDAGYGEQLLKACEEKAKKLKLKRLFALTTHTAHWFLEQGFRASEPSALPSRRQALYNWRRNSKVFLKRL
jgi:amino-acid N-acetyltransferase